MMHHTNKRTRTRAGDRPNPFNKRHCSSKYFVKYDGEIGDKQTHRISIRPKWKCIYEEFLLDGHAKFVCIVTRDEYIDESIGKVTRFSPSAAKAAKHGDRKLDTKI